ncbi:MAG: hypothetical protein ABR584_02700 [Candidatus Baltobacteraceae bacterium]
MYHFTRAAAAFFLVILLITPASASTKAGRHRALQHATAPSLDLYSHRARRRAATILQLELLEMRKAHLERVRKVIEKRLKLEALFSNTP